MEREQDEHLPLPAFAQLNDAIAVGDLQRSKQAELHNTASAPTVTQRRPAFNVAEMGEKWALMGEP
jgi:hypothetical protein